jgi:GNAT superfamily N-acetyltransferase
MDGIRISRDKPARRHGDESGDMTPSNSALTIRPARPQDHNALGKMLVSAYVALPGMPSPSEQPDYYAMLADVAARSRKLALTVFVAADPAGKLLGSIDFIDDMTQYGSGGTASTVTDAAGVRLLAVDAAARGKGVGKALTRFCIDRARETGKHRLVLHTTRVMQAAWAMYEALGFIRFPEIDFRQGNLDVFGFQLDLVDTASSS